MTKKISVGSYYAIVDDEDYDHLSEMEWAPATRGKIVYALQRGYGGKMMHQIITGFRLTDHANLDGLDNRRENLREATHSQNHANEVPRSGTSRFKGVSWDKKNSKWEAYITVNGIKKRLGRFSVEEDAALAYNCAAQEAWGEFSRLNEV